jgi:hypothetical protein
MAYPPDAPINLHRQGARDCDSRNTPTFCSEDPRGFSSNALGSPDREVVLNCDHEKLILRKIAFLEMDENVI